MIYVLFGKKPASRAEKIRHFFGGKSLSATNEVSAYFVESNNRYLVNGDRRHRKVAICPMMTIQLLHYFDQSNFSYRETIRKNKTENPVWDHVKQIFMFSRVFYTWVNCIRYEIVNCRSFHIIQNESTYYEWFIRGIL